jgi:hypothetical protein
VGWRFGGCFYVPMGVFGERFGECLYRGTLVGWRFNERFYVLALW